MVLMGSLFASPGQNYGVEGFLFAFTAVLLTLPLAALIAASLCEGLIRRRTRRGQLAPAPLALRADLRLSSSRRNELASSGCRRKQLADGTPHVALVTAR
jgi:hypothetical protein